MFKGIFACFSLLVLLSGCSSALKVRQEQREKLAATTGMFCEFVNGDSVADLDVELSMSMARRCDSKKSFSITNYKNSSNQSGVVYCCANARVEKKAAPVASPAPAATPAEAAPVEPGE